MNLSTAFAETMGFTQSGIRQMHEAALQVLRELGISVENETALQALARAGVRVQGSRPMRASPFQKII